MLGSFSALDTVCRGHTYGTTTGMAAYVLPHFCSLLTRMIVNVLVARGRRRRRLMKVWRGPGSVRCRVCYRWLFRSLNLAISCPGAPYSSQVNDAQYYECLKHLCVFGCNWSKSRDGGGI